MKQPFTYWKALRPNHKLYVVVGTMAVLIACELFVLTSAMDKVSSVRAFVEGEALWSKAQKNALIDLTTYQRTHDERFYREFLDYLKVPESDHRARMELMKPHPNLAAARAGFVGGGVDPADTYKMIDLLQHYYWISYVSSAIADWTKGDQLLAQIQSAAARLHEAVQSGDQLTSLRLLGQIKSLNAQLTPAEDHFSHVLGDGSRWIENRVMLVLLCMVIIVEATGLSLTLFTGREIAAVADENAKLFREAEQSVKIRDEFISIASHELKTPLTALTLRLYELAEKAKNPALGPEAERLKTLSERSLLSAERLAGLVDDLLDLTKIRIGRLHLNKERCDLTATLQDAANQLLPEASRQGCVIHVDTTGAIIGMFDRRRINQVALNLISNAVKYGPGKPISVQLVRDAERARIVVRDQGKGIAPEDIPKIFNRYERLVTYSEASGLGLGLYIANELVKSHGGTLVAESIQGQGATFTVELPIEG